MLETPTARVLDDGWLRFGFAQAHPFRWYGIEMGAFPGLEVGGRITELIDIEGEYFGNMKTRTLDCKYQIFPETKRFPAVAFGLQDPLGHKVFPSEYLAFSRQVYPLDFTLGVGHNRLGGDLNLPFLDNLGVFGGIEWAVTDQIHIVAEYSPIQYEEDRKRQKRLVFEEADAPINIGLKAKIFPGITVGLSYQRGNTLGFMVHLGAELGKQVLPQKPDPPVQTPMAPKAGSELDRTVDFVQSAIRKAGFIDVRVFTDGREMVAEFSNNRYLSNQKAVGRVLRILLFRSSADIQKITAVVKAGDMPFLRVSVDPRHLKGYLFGDISESAFTKVIEAEITEAMTAPPGKSYVESTGNQERNVLWGVKPEIETYLLDESRYVQNRVGIKPYVVADVWKNARLYARYDMPFYSDISSSADPPADAVRSDMSDYLGMDYSFEQLMIDQTFRLTDKTLARLSWGYLEKMYAGIGGEILSFIGDGRWAWGMEADWAIKREPGTQFELQDFDSYTVFGNLYRYFPGLNVTVNAKAGRFLYGDYGVRFELSREYDSGAVLGAWYTVTDSYKFSGFNEGFHDTGVFVSLPIRMFLDHDSPTRYTYGIKPWTRDVGAMVDHVNTLFNSFHPLTPAVFTDKLEKIEE